MRALRLSSVSPHTPIVPQFIRSQKIYFWCRKKFKAWQGKLCIFYWNWYFNHSRFLMISFDMQNMLRSIYCRTSLL